VFDVANPFLVILIALTPAASVLWRGRALLRHLHDPALPERLLANRSRNSIVFAGCAALLIVVAASSLAWALPLLVLARMLAAYPVRKAVYQETWTVGSYLSFYTRLVVAAFGFWVLLVTIPYLVMTVETGEWVVASVLATIAVSWSAGYSSVFRAVLDSRPIDDPALLDRFDGLVRRCGFRAVALEQVDLRGGTFANAVALPSLTSPAVLITAPLARRLDQDEAVAILGHELAHLEYYNPQRLRRNSVITWTLIVVGAFSVPVMRIALPQATSVISYVWPLVLVASMMLRARHRQKHETESDLRAVELTGDGEALVRALSKLHASSLIPRRWDHEMERRATHPSLARRIQAIRAASGVSQASLREAATFASADGPATTTFLEDRIQWDGESGDRHTMSYGALKELRIRMQSSESPRLIGVDRANRRWELMLKPEDVPRLQTVLDVVDGRLGTAETPPMIPPQIARVLTMLAMTLGLSMAHFSVLIATLLALVRPAAQLTAAAGVAVITSAALQWQRPTLDVFGSDPVQIGILLVAGLVLVGLSVATRRDAAHDRHAPRLVAVLGVSAFGMWALVLTSGLTAVDLHASARDFPSAAVLTMSLAAALALAKRPNVRWAAVPVAIVGLLAGYLGSTAFADHFIDDPLVGPTASVKVTTLIRPTLNVFSIDFVASDLWLSPRGQYVAFRSEDADERATIHAGRAGGELTAFSADDAMFVDEDRLLLVERQRRDSALHLIDLGSDARELWTVRVPVSWACVSVDRESRRWRMVGRRAGEDLASIEGQLEDDQQQPTEWRSPGADGGELEVLGVAGDRAVALERRPLPGLLSERYFSMWMLLIQPQPRSEIHFWAFDKRGRTKLATSRFDPSCRLSSALDGPGLCAAFDGLRTRFFTVDPGSRSLTNVAAVDGRFVLNGHSDRDWLNGWWDRGPALLRPTTHEALRVQETYGERLSQLAIGDAVIASISYRGRESIVRIYPRK
jgi:Zn-dependent protease with chaperone function